MQGVWCNLPSTHALICLPFASDHVQVLRCSPRIHSPTVLQGGDPFQGPSVRSGLTLGNELSGKTHVLTKPETFSGRGTGQRAAGEGAQQICAATWLPASGFRGRGSVSRCLWPVVLLDLGLVWHRVLSGGPHTSQPGWITAPRILESWPSPPSNGLSQPSRASGQLLFLIRASSGRQVMRTARTVPGQGGRFQSMVPEESGPSALSRARLDSSPWLPFMPLTSADFNRNFSLLLLPRLPLSLFPLS